MTDESTYLREQQYKDAANLDARKYLHIHFSTNRSDWYRWLFDHYVLPDEAAILELGTGPGDLWARNLDRLPAGWRITLSDFSPGMLEAARATLGKDAARFVFREIDAQSIPLGDASCDAVIANHMLYHVPDRHQALGEIHRVLKRGGALYAVTNSSGNLHELNELVARAVGESHSDWSNIQALPFTLENGAQQLAEYFDQVDLARREDSLLVTEVEPLVAYVHSASRHFQEDAASLERFRQLVSRELAEKGAIEISKDAGMFIAIKS